MKSILIILLFVLSYGSINAQVKRKNKDLIEYSRWRNSGWHLAPGLTYMVPFKPKADDAPEVDPNGRLAIYLEAGRWHLFPGGGNIFNYFDYSLAYKRLSGSEKFADNKEIFKQNHLLGNFNINNVIQLTDYTFIQNSLGVNLDWKFAERAPTYGANTQKLLFSLHYKLGFGIKATQKLFIIPTLETPILNLKQWEKARSDYGMFTSRYRPVIFTVRFAWLIKPNKNSCPPVPGGDGKKYDEMLQME
jgi:hypothetical protein